ncbi:D-arabinono-1,4-lactone oxidase [Arthrobacter sp. RC1.1 241]|jgi:FAD/FMN-containing dehydrogenase|uniref:D-arabinono-1,4-lactone oxidase n=1 Tax=Paenarthrobacter sp. 22069 TaxID=3453864 RepID=UPI000D7C2124
MTSLNHVPAPTAAAAPPVPYRTDATWTNWGGNQSATPAFTVQPRNEQEALDAVRFALREGLPVRAVGSGHSSSPLVQTGGVLMDMSRLSAITGTDKRQRRARAMAGTTINAFGDALWAQGLALGNQGDIDKQQIAGALATSTHGSGKDLGSFSSKLRWVKLINGYGEIVEIGEGQLRELRAAQVALGTLGVFLEVELDVEDKYYLQEQITYPTWAETTATWQSDIDSNRHYSFLWCPDSDSCELLDLPGSPGHDMTDRSYTKRYNVAHIQDESELSTREGARLDRSYRIYPGGFTTQFHELEYFVRSEDGLAAVEAVQDLIRTRHHDQKYPVEVRWVKADDAYMSQFQGRDSTVITLTTKPGTDYWQFFRDADAVLQEFEPRAHWGKIHFMTRSRLERLYPGLDTFIQVRREFDPRGIFLNDHTRALFG